MYFMKTVYVVFTCIVIGSVTALRRQSGYSTHPALSGNSLTDLTTIQQALKRTVSDMMQYQKRTCLVGINSQHCALEHMDNVVTSKHWLNSGFSPGKRKVDKSTYKRNAIFNLNHLVEELRALEPKNVKRTCSVNLGNHCLTESLDRAASQYYWLQSALSPGRRRRALAPSLTHTLTRKQHQHSHTRK